MPKARLAEIKTPLGDKLLLRSAVGHEELGRPFCYELELLSEDDAIKGSALLGQDATVTLSLQDESERYINGIVTAFSATGRVGRYATYSAQLRPWLWLLEHTRDCRIFQQETIPDIIQEVFREHGFSDLDVRLNATYLPLDYVVQYRETTLAFVTRLMERAGIYYFFKHEQNKHMLVLADSPSAHEPAPGYEEIPYFPPESRHAREHEHIHSWRTEEHFKPGRYALEAFDFKRPSADLSAKSADPPDHAKARFEIYDYPGDYAETTEGETLARMRLEAEHAQQQRVLAVSNARGLSSGNLFKLKGFKRADQNRQYMLVSVASELHVNGHESGGSLSCEYECKLCAVPALTDYRLELITPRPIVRGPQTAIVTGKKGDDIWTDEFARVKLQFHWDRNGKHDESSSCWVRVAQSWAGSGFGSIHIPRVGQEVVVDFLEGDPDRPLVTGRVYNANQRPPYELPGKATQSGIKSRSANGGMPNESNELRFEDKKGEEEVFLHAQKDFKQVVENDQSSEVHRDQSIVIGGSQSITIKGGHDLDKLKGAKLDVTGDYKVTASQNASVAAPHSLELTCGDMASIKMGPESITIAVGPSIVKLELTGITVTGPMLKLNQ